MRRVFLGVVVFLLVVIAVQRLARRDPVTAQAGPTFRCGDVDGDGTINITDPILLLNWLFLEGPEPACADPAPQGASGTAEFAEAGEHSWTCPEGVHAVMVELWGGCGGGGGAALHDSQAQMIPAGGGGGGAGAYVRTVVAVTPGQTYKLAVGRGGEGGLAGAVGFPEGRTGEDGTPTRFEEPGGSALALAGGGSGGNGGGLVSNVPGSVAPGGDGGAGGEPQAADGIRRAGAPGADAEDVTDMMATMSPVPPAHGGIGVGGSISAPHAVAWTRTPRSSMCDPAMASMCREDWSFLGRLAGGRGGSTWGYRWDPDAMISVRFSEPGDKGSDGYAVLQW